SPSLESLQADQPVPPAMAQEPAREPLKAKSSEPAGELILAPAAEAAPASSPEETDPAESSEDNAESSRAPRGPVVSNPDAYRINESDPSAPKKGGWWARARQALSGR